MTSTVTFPIELGGSGAEYSDGNDPTTGLGNDGHRTRLIPMLQDSVAIAAQGKLNMQAAQQAAASALAAPGTQATSTTSLLIGVGTKTLDIQPGKNLVQGSYVTIASVADETNAMFGPVADYDEVTGDLEVTVQYKTGGGTFANWTISICGPALDLSDDTPEPLGAASAGDSDRAARSNHVHEHGDQEGGTLHALASSLEAGFMSPESYEKAEAAIPIDYLDDDEALTDNSDEKIPTQKAVKAYAMPAGYLDTDGTLAANSDTKVPSQQAVKEYVDARGAMELVSVATASNSAAIDFTNLNSAFDYIVVAEGVRPATTGRSIGLRVSTNNGSSYAAGASDYSQADIGSLINTNGDGTSIPITGAIATGTASDSGGFEVRVQNIGSTTIRKTVYGHSIGEAGSGAVRKHSGGYYKGSLSAVNAIRFFVIEGGNISAGTFRLYRIKRT